MVDILTKIENENKERAEQLRLKMEETMKLREERQQAIKEEMYKNMRERTRNICTNF